MRAIQMTRQGLQYLTMVLALLVGATIWSSGVRAEAISAAGTQIWGDPSQRVICWRGNVVVDHLGDFDSPKWKRALNQSASSGCTTLTGSGRFNLYANNGRSAFMINREGTDGLGLGANVCRACDHPNGCALKLTANPQTDASCLANVPYQGSRQTTDASIASDQVRAVWAMGDQPIPAAAPAQAQVALAPTTTVTAKAPCYVRPGQTFDPSACSSVTYMQPATHSSPPAVKKVAAPKTADTCRPGQKFTLNGVEYLCQVLATKPVLPEVAAAPAATESAKPAAPAPAAAPAAKPAEPPKK